MFLIINTNTLGKIVVALARRNNLIAERSVKTKFHETEKLLLNIHKILEENKFKLIDLEGVVVANGPGAFTSLRIGVVTANVLAFTLGIPVVGVKLSEVRDKVNKVDKVNEEIEREELETLVGIGFWKLKKAKRGEFILPFYGKAPHITTLPH